MALLLHALHDSLCQARVLPEDAALQRAHRHPAGLQAEVHVTEAQQAADHTACNVLHHFNRYNYTCNHSCAPAHIARSVSIGATVTPASSFTPDGA
jgi:hypothetical protein